MSNVDLIRKHLPKGWRVDYRLTLVPDDGRSPKLLTEDAINNLVANAARIEHAINELQSEASMMVGYGDDES